VNLKQELDAMAAVLIKKAKENNTPLTDVIDAFKSVTAYYALDLKRKAREPAEDEDEESFAGFQERLKEVENGSQVGSDRRSRGNA
jgi:hypothetical protein